MTATNKTTNYKLPQWVGTDNLSIMGDMNGAFGKIDETLKTFDDNIQVAKATATGASEISASSSVTAQSALQKATEALQKATEALEHALYSKAYKGKVIITDTLDTMEKVIAQHGGKRWSMLTDRIILGAGGKYGVNVTGGEETHTLSIEELPSHKHDVVYMQGVSPRKAGVYRTNAGNGNGFEAGSYGETGTNRIGEYTTTNVGGNKAFNILPPFTTMYIWVCQEV